MTTHQTQNHRDRSVSVRRYRGGWWTVREGWEDCDAERFVEAQNRHIRDFHQPAVRGYLGKGEAA